MVVQCPSCRSRFRVADEKVTDRGVRVRCTNCKTVFPVRKQDAVAGSTGPIERDGASTGPVAPTPAQRPHASKKGARPLASDDLFGEGEPAPPAIRARPPTGKVSPSKPPPSATISLAESATELNEPSPTPNPTANANAASTAEPEPFESLELDETALPKTGPQKLASGSTTDRAVRTDKPLLSREERRAGDSAPPERASRTGEIRAPPSQKKPRRSAGRELVTSALTGLAGAALAILTMLAGAISQEEPAGWMGLGKGPEVVATRVASGLYETVSGKPVFFIRGRVENRGKRPRGPVKVVAELVAEDGSAISIEALAGKKEPSPEEVYLVRTGADAEQLTGSLKLTDAERVQPGKSVPFFAMIADPPRDVQKHRLRLRVETIDAWSPPPRSAEAPR